MAYQYLTNSRTGEVRAIDISKGTAEVASLHRQGWRTSTLLEINTSATQKVKPIQPAPSTIARIPAAPVVFDPAKLEEAISQAAAEGKITAAIPAPSPSVAKPATGLYYPKPQVSLAAWQQLTPSMQSRVELVDPLMSSAPSIWNRIADTFTEAISLGKIETKTYNRDDLERQYTHQQQILGAIYDGDVKKLDHYFAEGLYNNPDDWQKDIQIAQESAKIDDKAITKEAYITQNLGSEKNYVNTALATQPALRSLVNEVALGLIPFATVTRHWGTLSPNEKKAYLGLDILSLIPPLWFFTRGISALARLGYSVPKATMTSAARVALAEATAPYQMLRHPIETVKAPINLIREAFGKRRVPYEVVVGSVKAPGIRTGVSDVRMNVKAGMEEGGATRQAAAELQTGLVSGNPHPATMQGLRAVEITPTGLQDILGGGQVLHGGPGFEGFLTALERTGTKTTRTTPILRRAEEILEPGYVLVQSKEGGLYTAGTGTLFHQAAAHGGIGQIPFQAVIDTPGVVKLPRHIAGVRDPSKMETVAVEAFGSGRYADDLSEGFKIYARTAEGELVILDGSQLYLVPGPRKTFKWKDPYQPLIDRANSLRFQTKAKIEKLNKLTQEISELQSTGMKNEKLERQLLALRKDIKSDIKQVVKLEKEAIDKGTPRQITLNIDHLEIVDPMTGKKVLVPHFAMKGVNTKPWTKMQILALKKRGYMNIPRDITTPSLKYPHITPAEQISLIRNRLSSGEALRLDAGLELGVNLSRVDIPTTGLKFDISKIDIMGSLPHAAVNRIRETLVDFGKDIRVYGSTVEQVFTKGKVIAGDLDLAAKNPGKVSERLVRILQNNNITPKVRVVAPEAGGGGGGVTISIMKDGKWETLVDIRSLKEHMDLLPYGLKTRDSVVVNGIHMETLGEQLNRRISSMLFPGFGPQGTHMIGPEAAFKLNRLKDIPRTEIAARELLEAATRQANTLPAALKEVRLKEIKELQRALNTLMDNQIPTTITTKMKSGLVDLGYSSRAIGKMSPVEAMVILGHKTTDALEVTRAKVLTAMNNLDITEEIRYLEEQLRMPASMRWNAMQSGVASKTPFSVARATMAMAENVIPRPSITAIRANIKGRVYDRYARNNPESFARYLGRFDDRSRQEIRDSLSPRDRRALEREEKKIKRSPVAPLERRPFDEDEPRIIPPPDRVPPRGEVPRYNRDIPPKDRVPPNGRIPRILSRVKPVTPPFPVLGSGKDGIKRRELYEGAVAWKQGKLRDNVWHIINSDGRKITLYTIHVGEKPPYGVEVHEGMRKALTSLKEKGKLPDRFDIDIGAFDLVKRGDKYYFRKDPKGRTRGDVSAKDAVVTIGRVRG